MGKGKAKEEIVRTTIRMPRSIWEKVQHRAIDERKGIAELVLEAVNDYLRKGD